MNFNALLSRAAANKKNKNRRFTYALENGDTLEFVSIPDDQLLDEMDPIAMDTEDRTLSSIVEATDHLIYKCCPELQNPELHAQLDVVEPWDVVKEIFSLAERNAIGGALLDFLNVSALAADVKNA